MTMLDDLLDQDALEIELQDGYVRERRHPTNRDLIIFNYTEKAQYENRWNDVTRQCRGLIVDYPSGKVVARPFPKFLNYGQHQEGSLPLDAAVEVTDKLDGSLGILYHDGDDWAIATRGSFESDQAKHATELYRRIYRDHFQPPEGVTYLFEIVYPGNRIVLDYGLTDDLLLLGAVNIATGKVTGPTLTSWTGPRAATFEAATLADALALPPRPNAEGVVVRYRDGSDLMVKIKQEDYVRLHKIVTGMSERGVWEHLAANQGSVDGLLEVVPDEWHGWLREVSGALLDQFEELQGRAHAAYDEIVASGPEVWPSDRDSRAAFARSVLAREDDLAPLLFRLVDGKPLDAPIWKRIRPVGHRPMTNQTEEVA